jgi:hypothetical protein
MEPAEPLGAAGRSLPRRVRVILLVFAAALAAQTVLFLLAVLVLQFAPRHP